MSGLKNKTQPNSNYVHFMTRLNKRSGWIAPSELLENVFSKGSFVVPVYNGSFANEYYVDVSKYLGDGQRSKIETFKVIRVKNTFILMIKEE
jgi:hypothetical protein